MKLVPLEVTFNQWEKGASEKGLLSHEDISGKYSVHFSMVLDEQSPIAFSCESNNVHLY
jgi:hypothetical protein